MKQAPKLMVVRAFSELQNKTFEGTLGPQSSEVLLRTHSTPKPSMHLYMWFHPGLSAAKFASKLL